MTVRAKMRCNGRSEKNWGQSEGVDAIEVTLQAVYSNDKNDPNYSWSQASPSGELKLLITNPAAYEQFKLGKAYFVDFTPAE